MYQPDDSLPTLAPSLTTDPAHFLRIFGEVSPFTHLGDATRLPRLLGYWRVVADPLVPGLHCQDFSHTPFPQLCPVCFTALPIRFPVIHLSEVGGAWWSVCGGGRHTHTSTTYNTVFGLTMPHLIFSRTPSNLSPLWGHSLAHVCCFFLSLLTGLPPLSPTISVPLYGDTTHTVFYNPKRHCVPWAVMQFTGYFILNSHFVLQQPNTPHPLPIK